MDLDLSPWMKRWFTAMWLGSLAFSVGAWVAEALYERVRRQ